MGDMVKILLLLLLALAASVGPLSLSFFEQQQTAHLYPWQICECV